MSAPARALIEQQAAGQEQRDRSDVEATEEEADAAPDEEGGSEDVGHRDHPSVLVEPGAQQHGGNDPGRPLPERYRRAGSVPAGSRAVNARRRGSTGMPTVERPALV